jgi:hypothetical protein
VRAAAKPKKKRLKKGAYSEANIDDADEGPA